MKRIFATFTATIMATTLCTTTHSQTMSCDEVAKEMSVFSKQKKSNNSPEWQKLSWLKATIGYPEIKKTSQKTYTWDKFLLSISDGKTSAMSLNTDPNNSMDRKLMDLTIQTPTLATITNLLGEPKKIKDFEMLSYIWNCPDSKSNLAVKLITNKTSGNTKTNYSGRYCQSNICKTFHF